MQPMMPGYGWGNQKAWQPFPGASGGSNIYWPNNGHNANIPHVGNYSASSRGPPHSQQTPQSFGHSQRTEDVNRLPPLVTSPSPSQLSASSNGSQYGSFRQKRFPASGGGAGMSSLHGSFRRVPSGSLDRGPPNSTGGTFRHQVPAAPPTNVPLQLPRDAGHLAPLSSPVAVLSDSESLSSSDGLTQEKLEIQKELSQLLGRKTSSRRILRRQVSFQGIRMTEEERRLQAELQRLREEEQRRRAAEAALMQQHSFQSQQEMERQRAEAEQQQIQQLQQAWSLQAGAYDHTNDDGNSSEYNFSPPATPQSLYSPQQLVTPPNVATMPNGRRSAWNSRWGTLPVPQQPPMYGMYYGGQLPPVARFPQQNPFSTGGSPPTMAGIYLPQPMGRRF